MGGTGLAKTTITGNLAKSNNRGGSWNLTKNEEEKGANPYAGGSQTMAA